MVQLNYDEEMEPLHGMYGSVEAEFDVQRTINFLVPPWESMWTHQGPCGQQGYNQQKVSKATLPRAALFWVQWRTCGRAVVQLDYDEEMGPLHRMYG